MPFPSEFCAHLIHLEEAWTVHYVAIKRETRPVAITAIAVNEFRRKQPWYGECHFSPKLIGVDVTVALAAAITGLPLV